MRNVVSVALSLVLLGSVAKAADYDMRLWNSYSLTAIGSSNWSGTQMDWVEATAGSLDDNTDWEVEVYHFSGDVDAGYTLDLYINGSWIDTFVASYEDSYLVRMYDGETLRAELFPNADDDSSSSDCGATGSGLPGALALLIPLAGVFVAMRRRLGLVSA